MMLIAYRGKYTATKAASENDRVVLRGLLVNWFSAQKKKPAALIQQDNTFKTYWCQIKKLLAWLDRKGLSFYKLDKRALNDYLTEAGGAPASTCPRLAAFKALIAALNEEGVGMSFPAGVRRPRIKKGGHKAPFDWGWFEDAWSRIGDQRLKVVVGLAGYGGLRESEIAGLTASDYRSGFLTILGKGAQRRIIPVPTKLKPVLEAFIQGRKDGYLFGNGKPPARTTVWRWVHAWYKAQGVNPDGGVHRLRHTAGTRLYALTGDIAVVQDYLGHQNPETTRIYVGANPYRMQQAVAGM